MAINGNWYQQMSLLSFLGFKGPSLSLLILWTLSNGLSRPADKDKNTEPLGNRMVWCMGWV